MRTKLNPATLYAQSEKIKNAFLKKKADLKTYLGKLSVKDTRVITIMLAGRCGLVKALMAVTVPRKRKNPADIVEAAQEVGKSLTNELKSNKNGTH